MKVTNRLVVGVIAGIICLPLIAALAGAANVEATWRSSEDGFVNFASYGYGGPRPDALIRLGASGSFVGNNIYNDTGTGQTVSTTVGRGGSRTFTVRFANDGTTAGAFRVVGAPSNSQFKISYFAAETDITGAVVNGIYTTGTLAPGARTSITVVVKAKVGTPPGAKVTVPVVAGTESLALLDQVKAKVKRV